jgi:hypothetical protein
MIAFLLCSCFPAGLDWLGAQEPGENVRGGELDGVGSDDGTGGDDGGGDDGTGGDGAGGDDGGGGEVPAPPEALAPARQLARASIALRGLPPSLDELEAIEADPTQLESLVEGYLYDPAFLETLKDAYAERLLLRRDQMTPFVSEGPLRFFSESEAMTMMESPLQLIAHVVDDDRPFTDIVTTNDVWVNEPLAAAIGPDWNPNGDEWQRVNGWGDDRPAAGLLGHTMLWIRHQSMGSNDQRGRANVVADAFLCESFTDRDVDIDGTIDLTSEDAILDAVNNNENCLACHQALEPLAANFWGFQLALTSVDINASYDSGCGSSNNNCYPIEEYDSDDLGIWKPRGLRSPGFYGTPVDDLADLGRQISEDPRFAQCVVRTVYGYMTQRDRNDVPLATVAKYQDVFEASDYNVRELAKAIVTSPEFLADGNDEDGGIGLLNLRPEALSRTMASLTGFVWRAGYDDAGCVGFDCFGDVDLMNSDYYGFRALAGGVDGMYVTVPLWDTSPSRVMAIDVLASEAAAWVVTADLRQPDLSRRRLLTLLSNPIDPDEIRAQLAALTFRFYGERVDADDPSLDAAYELLDTAYHGDATRAWTLVVAAMLQDPALLFY